jgi:transglutaminase-like putative cysteine protease
MLNRRSFLLATSGAAFLSRIDLPARAAENPPLAGWRRFELTTLVDLSAESAPAQLWLPLAQSVEGYQRRVAADMESNGVSSRLRDARYGAELVRVDWTQAGGRTAKLVQVVDVLPRAVLPAALSPERRAFWLQPTRSAPIDGIVADIARRIVGERRDPEQKARAIYDWVVDHTFRESSTRGCGVGDVKAMLETGWLGGKCADINTLMTGLCRASGLPARDVYGLRTAPSQESRSLGASGEVTKAQHCRSEIFIDGKGWLPVDPADVRKIVLEERAPLDSDHVRAQRARLFGGWEMNWVGYNSATDIVLPDALRPMASNFLMYPCGMTIGAEVDCLDPGAFRYRIFSRETSA